MLINKELLESAGEGDIIASGIFRNGPDNIYLSDSGLEVVRWVAVRGSIPDWAIYHEELYHGDEVRTDFEIARMGDKVGSSRLHKIPGLELDDFAKSMYRD